MNREIKFKAFIYHKKQMLTDREFDIDSWQNVIILKSNDATFSYYGSVKSCELIEFTGLKDKNGKEIFEGDSDGMYFVVFENGCFKLETKKGNIVGLLSNFINEGFEVIGNIFENPELSAY